MLRLAALHLPSPFIFIGEAPAKTHALWCGETFSRACLGMWLFENRIGFEAMSPRSTAVAAAEPRDEHSGPFLRAGLDDAGAVHEVRKRLHFIRRGRNLGVRIVQNGQHVLLGNPGLGGADEN